MLSAQEAFVQSRQKLEETVQSIDELLVIDQRIKDSVEKGWFVAYSDAVSIQVGERLAIELEEYGYFATVQRANMMDAEKKPLVYVTVNWKYKPNSSRVECPVHI